MWKATRRCSDLSGLTSKTHARRRFHSHPQRCRRDCDCVAFSRCFASGARFFVALGEWRSLLHRHDYQLASRFDSAWLTARLRDGRASKSEFENAKLHRRLVLRLRHRRDFSVVPVSLSRPFHNAAALRPWLAVVRIPGLSDARARQSKTAAHSPPMVTESKALSSKVVGAKHL